MPWYEFHCSACQHDFGSLMKPHDPVECPKCKTKEEQSYEGGTITRKWSVTSPHQWKCSSAGAAPRRGR